MAETRAVPAPDDPRKPSTPRRITLRSWSYVARTTVREFIGDNLTDLAAALTFYAVLSIFPGIIALVSIFNLLGQDPRVLQNLVDEVTALVDTEDVDFILAVIDNLLTPRGAGLGLVVGIVVALWSASRYVKALGRAMNRIYDVPEGRPFWKYHLQMYGLTAVILVLVAVAVALLVLSGSVAEWVGALIGLGPNALAAWDVAKWPVLALVVVVLLALLYYATPNVRQPRFRWVSVGAVAAILIAALATLGFGVYVSNWGNFDATYGTLAGVIVFLFWLWFVNLAVLFGGELDAELERARQLQAGFSAEREILLPPRDVAVSEKRRETELADIERGRALRLSSGRTDDIGALDNDVVAADRSDERTVGVGEKLADVDAELGSPVGAAPDPRASAPEGAGVRRASGSTAGGA